MGDALSPPILLLRGLFHAALTVGCSGAREREKRKRAANAGKGKEGREGWFGSVVMAEPQDDFDDLDCSFKNLVKEVSRCNLMKFQF